MNDKLPRHVAIVMDGNGRWAQQRHLPRVAGHKAGVAAVREIVTVAAEKKISTLTIFAFGQENWRRPSEEVGFLMNLFLTTLRREVKKLHKNNVRLLIIGDRTQLNSDLQQAIAQAEMLTAANNGLCLVIAVNYSGRWDIMQAAHQLAKPMAADLSKQDVADFSSQLATGSLPDPDLFIRTSGEYRISNFMLWQLAYTELYFTETLWPDFKRADFEAALSAYAQRQRRFGQTGEQVQNHEAVNSGNQ